MAESSGTGGFLDVPGSNEIIYIKEEPRKGFLDIQGEKTMNESSMTLARARVVKDPELRYSSKGTPFLNLRLVYKGGNHDIFINGVLTGKPAEAFKIDKGDLLSVHGDLEENVWQAQGGEKRLLYIHITKLFVLKKKGIESHNAVKKENDDFVPEDIDI